MKVLQKKILSGIVLSVFFSFALIPLQAGAKNPAGIDESVSRDYDSVTINTFTKFDAGNVANDPRAIIIRIINVVMGFLGMLAVLLILFAGFKWMTAGGNKEHMESAAKMLRDGVIGLIIIFSAWTLAWFVVNTIKVNVGE